MRAQRGWGTGGEKKTETETGTGTRTVALTSASSPRVDMYRCEAVCVGRADPLVSTPLDIVSSMVFSCEKIPRVEWQRFAGTEANGLL